MKKFNYKPLLKVLTDNANDILTELSNGHQAIDISFNGNKAYIVRHSGEVISNGETLYNTHRFLVGFLSSLVILHGELSVNEVIITDKEQALFTEIWEEYDDDKAKFIQMVIALTPNQFADAQTFFRNSTHVDHWKDLHVVTPAEWSKFIADFIAVWEAEHKL